MHFAISLLHFAAGIYYKLLCIRHLAADCIWGRHCMVWKWKLKVAGSRSFECSPSVVFPAGGEQGYFVWRWLLVSYKFRCSRPASKLAGGERFIWFPSWNICKIQDVVIVADSYKAALAPETDDKPSAIKLSLNCRGAKEEKIQRILKRGPACGEDRRWLLPSSLANSI